MLDTPANHTLDRHTNHRPRHAPQPSGAIGTEASGPATFWCVVQTHPQAERWAASSLAQRGYQTYLPLLAVQRRDRATHRMMHTVQVPLFAGYLFVQTSLDDPWTPIAKCPGVRSILTANGKPQALPQGLVGTLQATEAARRSTNPLGASWAPGAACKAVHGPFKGHEAVVISVTGNKATIALPLFGSLRELTVPVDWLTSRN